MSTLYIDRKHSSLAIQSGTLVTYINNQRQGSLPLPMVERLIILTSLTLESSLLLKLASEGIAVSIINPRKASQHISLLGKAPKNPYVRLKQYAKQADVCACADMANLIVMAKIKGHIRFLRTVTPERPDQRYAIKKTLKSLRAFHQRLRQDKSLSLETIRGIEGSAARLFFKAYQHLLPDSLNFTGRNRRPPKDPVNACLSLAYTLLHHRAAQQAYAHGLDPMIGYLHDPSYSRESLASDHIEPWRPVIDEWVWTLFRDKTLREHHFSTSEQGCLLNKTGRHKFFGAFERLMKPLSRAMRWQVLRFIRLYLNEQAI